MKRYLAVTGLTLIVSALAVAQEGGGQRVVVPARNSSRPRQLKVNTLHAGITVHTYAGKDVIVESAGATPRRGRERDRQPAPDGMHRIDMPAGGFTVEEEDNVITLKANTFAAGNITVSVPVDTSVQIKSTFGPVVVDGVHGEVDVSNTNGAVTLMNISGNIVAETTNGSVKAVMDRVDPAKPLSFSSTNGSIDVTLPADLKANLKMRSFNGSIWTDFDMKMGAGSPPVTTSPGGADGRFQVKFDRTVTATINGGGVEASFSTLNGRIMIKKK
jgi:predicted membrane protein